MLTLLVPGVGMGGTGTSGAGGGTSHLLMIMGVGRSWLMPFLLFLGVTHGR